MELVSKYDYFNAELCFYSQSVRDLKKKITINKLSLIMLLIT